MGVNLGSFVTTAERAGMPVRLLRFVIAGGYRIEPGSWNQTPNYGRVIYLQQSVIDSLRRASFGLRWERDQRTGVFEQLNSLEYDDVGTLYHEAMHAYFVIQVNGPRRQEFAALLLRAQESYKGARVERGGTNYIADNPGRIVLEACSEYVGARAQAMWRALDMLYELRQRADQKKTDCNLLKRYLEQVRIDYEKELAVDIRGYEEDDDGNEYQVVDRPVPANLVQACEAVLDAKIPRRFMAAPNLARLYYDILRRLECRVQIDINFATDEDQPLPASEPALQALVKSLQDDPSLRVELIGHTDTQGSISYNMDLSQRRAASVYRWLVQRGIDSGRLRTDARGLGEPIADNTSEAGRARNRRVEARALN